MIYFKIFGFFGFFGFSKFSVFRFSSKTEKTEKTENLNIHRIDISCNLFHLLKDSLHYHAAQLAEYY